uniref:Uncharacterized protein n=1 Tax=Strigamia maritima TaxID=126957 RepID=T1IX68_STRMM
MPCCPLNYFCCGCSLCCGTITIAVNTLWTAISILVTSIGFPENIPRELSPYFSKNYNGIVTVFLYISAALQFVAFAGLVCAIIKTPSILYMVAYFLDLALSIYYWIAIWSYYCQLKNQSELYETYPQQHQFSDSSQQPRYPVQSYSSQQLRYPVQPQQSAA